MNINKPGGYTRTIINDRLLEKKPPNKKCSIEGCNSPVGAGNYFLCESHFRQADTADADGARTGASLRRGGHL